MAKFQSDDFDGYARVRRKTTMQFYRDEETASRAALKIVMLGHEADVVPVPGDWPWAVTFDPLKVM